jgi:dTDP-4-amino-4,6-dideoxygalactose transaminase
MDAGYKYNMTDLQAALGLAQLRKIERMWERRRLIAMRYTEAFKNMEEIIPPFVKEDRVSAWHLYIIKLNLEALKIDRAAFIEELGKRDIGTSVHFIPLHKHPFYRNKYNCKVYGFPVAEWIYERSISLPVYPVIPAKIQMYKKYPRRKGFITDFSLIFRTFWKLVQGK